MAFDEKARPFFSQGNDCGVLIVHGITGTPAHMLHIATECKKQGWTVNSILLSGHGTTLEDMVKYKSEDWIADVKTGYERLKTTGCKKNSSGRPVHGGAFVFDTCVRI